MTFLTPLKLPIPSLRPFLNFPNPLTKLSEPLNHQNSQIRPRSHRPYVKKHPATHPGPPPPPPNYTIQNPQEPRFNAKSNPTLKNIRSVCFFVYLRLYAHDTHCEQFLVQNGQLRFELLHSSFPGDKLQIGQSGTGQSHKRFADSTT